jgi:hypothetical protein
MLPRVCLLAVLCLLSASPVAFADPPVLSSTTGTCRPANGTSNWTTPYVSGADNGVDDMYDLRVTADGGPATWTMAGDDPFAWTAATTNWSLWELPTGYTPSGMISCAGAPADVNWSVSWYSLPHAPTTFTGDLDPGDESDLGFRATNEGWYTDDVTVSGGSVDVYQGDTSETVTSSGGGRVLADDGLNEISLENTGAAPVHYTVSIAAAHPGLQLLEAPTAGYTHSGVPLTYRYSLAIPATVNIDVLSSSGTVVRTLVDGDELAAGEHSVTWDGASDHGSPVGEGRYTLRFRARNAAILDELSRSSPLFDNNAPLIGVVVPYAGTSDVWVSAQDRTSGVQAVTVSVDGKATAAHPGAGGWLATPVPTPSAGVHNVDVTVTDGAGNTTQVQRAVTFPGVATIPGVAGPLPSPPCSAADGVGAVLGSRTLVHAVARNAHIDASRIFEQFKLQKALCADLTGDGVTDLAVMLKGRGHLSHVTPVALFRGSPGRFMLAYADSRGEFRSMSLTSRDVVLRPAGRGLSHRLVTLHWDGRAFAVRKAH